MNRKRTSPPLFAKASAIALALAAALPAAADDGIANGRSAAALSSRFAALERAPDPGPFGRALYLESTEGKDRVSGEIHAVVSQPFAVTSAALSSPSHWCDVLLLHLNTKHCRAASAGAGQVLHVGIGGKHDEPASDAYRVEFGYRVAARTANFLQVNLLADAGPLGTRDYRIVLAATPAGEGRTLIQLSYSYRYGFAGRLAMDAYLGTIGRDKVGFTVLGKHADGGPRYVGGMRGVVERNSMRYYLAVESFLGAQALPAPSRRETSLRDWFSASERYPLQLHEIERADYLAMKRKEFAR